MTKIMKLIQLDTVEHSQQYQLSRFQENALFLGVHYVKLYPEYTCMSDVTRVPC